MTTWRVMVQDFIAWQMVPVTVTAEAQFIDRGGVLNFLVFDKKEPDPVTGRKKAGKPKGRSVRTFAPGVWKDIEELPNP